MSQNHANDDQGMIEINRSNFIYNPHLLFQFVTLVIIITDCQLNSSSISVGI